MRWLYSTGSNVASHPVLWPWIQTVTMLVFVVLVHACAGGCARTVLVTESSPVRAGPSFQGKVYTLVENEWRLSPNEVTIPEGWYMVPPSYVESPHE